MTRHVANMHLQTNRLEGKNPVSKRFAQNSANSASKATPPNHENNEKLHTALNFISRFSLVLLLCVAAYVITGFIRFSSHVSSAPIDNVAGFTNGADGIVVLTGGAERVKTGLELLADGKAKRLLISGVHPKTSAKAIQHVSNAEMSLLECCVDLDKNALDTIGNAQQTANWARENKFSSLIIVTSTYHMPRSLLEMRRIMPDMDIKPFRVRYKPLQEKSWIHNPNALQTIVSEYLKYLAASIKNRITSADHQLVLSRVDR